MIFELLTIGSLGFYLFCIFAFILEFIFVGLEKLWSAIVGILTFFGVLFFCTNFNFSTFFSENLEKIIWGIVFYIAMAVIWATFKWWRQFKQRGKVYAHCLWKWSRDEKVETIKSINDIPINKRMEFMIDAEADFKKELNERFYMSMITSRKSEKDILEYQEAFLSAWLSSPKDNKERISLWMVAWPLSMLTTIIYDFIFEIFTWIRKALGDLYIGIARKSFGEYSNDFKSVKVEKEI